MHPKIKDLKLRAAPVTHSSMSVDMHGEIVEDNKVKGYLIVWGVRDTYGTIFLRGCCAKSLQERGPDSSSKYKITMLWQHDQRDPIGQFSTLQEDDYGLYFEADIDDVASGKRAVKQIRSGTLNQFSVGFNYIWDKVDYDEKEDALILREIDLYEGSVVTIASNHETYAMRSPEQLAGDLEAFQEDVDEFIRSIPRKQQLELRQLFARQKSLATVEPLALRQQALNNNEPTETGIDYAYISQNLNLFK